MTKFYIEYIKIQKTQDTFIMLFFYVDISLAMYSIYYLYKGILSGDTQLPIKIQRKLTIL